MAWRRLATERHVYVDLQDDFTNPQLLQGLIDAGWISEVEAEAIAKRAAAKEKAAKVLEVRHDGRADLDTATDYLRRGLLGEARIHLERALGRDWIGVLSS